MKRAPSRRTSGRAASFAALFVFCAAACSNRSEAPSVRSADEIELGGGLRDDSSTEPELAERGPWQPPPKKRAPAPDPNAPSRGAATAPVVVQIWSDFQCPFCQALAPTLHELERAYPGRVRIVWHDLPLAMHEHARAAASAAREARAQLGDNGFWQMHDLIFAAGDVRPAALRAYAARVKLDLARFERALAGRVHDRVIDRDRALAATLGIEATPSLLINDYYVVGALPLSELERIVELALRDVGGNEPRTR